MIPTPVAVLRKQQPRVALLPKIILCHGVVACCVDALRPVRHVAHTGSSRSVLKFLLQLVFVHVVGVVSAHHGQQAGAELWLFSAEGRKQLASRRRQELLDAKELEQLRSVVLRQGLERETVDIRGEYRRC